MKFSKVFLCSQFFLFTCLPLSVGAAQEIANSTLIAEPYIVTASHIALPANAVSSDVTVITEAELIAQKPTDLADALKNVAGIDVVRSGNGLTSVFARGSRSSSMLVLLDGVPVNDPSSASFDFSRIDLVNVERIEVVLGAQSSIYGANALSGVVNIISKRGQGKPSLTFYAEAGYPAHGKLSLTSGGSNELLAWSLGVTSRYSNLFSSAPKRFGNTEQDEIKDGAFSSSLFYTPSDMFDIALDVRADVQQLDYDSWTEDSYARYNSRRFFVRIAPTLRLFDDVWTQKLNLSFTDHRNASMDDPFGDNVYRGQVLRADWQNIIDLEWHTLVLGATAGLERSLKDSHKLTSDANKNRAVENYALYAEYTVNPIENLFLTGAWRLDKNMLYSPQNSYKLALAYTVAPTATFFHASYGTAYKAPSLSELYGLWGNKDLKPEYSQGWDIGVKQPLFDGKVELAATYYNMSYKDFIGGDYDSVTWKPINFGKATASGIELGMKFNSDFGLTLNTSATFAKSYLYKTEATQLRQPNVSFRVDLDYLLPLPVKTQFTVGATYSFVGAREDIAYVDAYTSKVVRVSSYGVLDLRAKADINENLSLSLKIGNILNEKYEAVWGYTSLGTSAVLGVSWKF